MKLYRRTRKSPTTTVKDFTEGDLIPNTTTAYVESLQPAIVDAGDGKSQLKIGDALGLPFAPGGVDDYDPRLDDARQPIDGSVTLAKLHPSLASVLSGAGSEFFTTASGRVLNADSAANAAQKTTFYGVPHYTNAEEPVAGVRVVAQASANLVHIGGGTGLANAATEISFYTAANSTTTTGTLRTTISNAGVLIHRGDLFVGLDTDTGTREVRIRSAAEQSRIVSFQTGTANRWLLRCNGDVESGGNAGSNLRIEARADDGSLLSTPIAIARATGAVTIGGTLIASAGLRLTPGAHPSPVTGDVWIDDSGNLCYRYNSVTKTVSVAA